MQKIVIFLFFGMFFGSWITSQDLEHSQGFWLINNASDNSIEKVDWDDIIVLTPEHAIQEKGERKDYVNFKFKLTYYFKVQQNQQQIKVSNFILFDNKNIYRDRHSKLKNDNRSEIDIYLNPYNKDGSLSTKEHILSIVLDGNNTVEEQDEDNNQKQIRIVFDGFQPLQSIKPDLHFLEDVFVINDKKVEFGKKIILTPDDAVPGLKSAQGYPAFSLGYAIESSKLERVVGFTNEVYQGKNIVAVHRGLATDKKKVVKINTPVFLNTVFLNVEEDAELTIVLDVYDRINEENENNNIAKIQIQFDGFSQTKLSEEERREKLLMDVTNSLFIEVNTTDLTEEQQFKLQKLSKSKGVKRAQIIQLNKAALKKDFFTISLFGDQLVVEKTKFSNIRTGKHLLLGKINEQVNSIRFFIRKNSINGVIQNRGELFSISKFEKDHVVAELDTEIAGCGN